MWKCEVCGYIHEGEAPPSICPICGVGSDSFTQIETVEKPTIKHDGFKCSVCGYEHFEEQPPEICPICGVGPDFFESIEKTIGNKEQTGNRVLIVGAGIAGLNAAEKLRASSKDAVITLFNNEKHAPYYRLNLTRFLALELEKDKLSIKNESWFEKNNINLINDEVVSIDKLGKSVKSRSGKIYHYDKLILTTGSHAFVPPIEGVGLIGVKTLRTLKDAENILEFVHPGMPCIVIGGGLLGIETAGALKKRGGIVTILEGASRLLPRQLSEKGALLLAEYIEKMEISFEFNVQVEKIIGSKFVEGVKLKDGREFVASLVVLSTGVRPNTFLARQAGLKVSRGLLVDDYMQTSDTSIFAAGDLVEHRGSIPGIWPVAVLQSGIAGQNADGQQKEYSGLVPTTRLKVLGVDVFSGGIFQPEDSSYQVYEVSKGSEYVRLVTRDGALVGANLIGNTNLVMLILDALKSGEQVATIPKISELLNYNKGKGKMASIKGTQTEKNLLASFAGESQARMRYDYAASVARKAGYKQIANIFEETAQNEKEHAKRFFKFLEGGVVEITAGYPAGIIGDTAENLLAAAMGENEEWTELYPQFAQTAREEGFPAIAVAYEMIAKAEKEHEDRFRTLLANLQNDRVFKKEEPVRWKCSNCGYVHEGLEAPSMCPACLHPQGYFEVKETNY